MDNLTNTFNKQHPVVRVAIAAGIAFAVYTLFFKKSQEGMSPVGDSSRLVQGDLESNLAMVMQIPEGEQPVPASVVEPRAQLAADELLPKYDEANEFAKQNPVTDLLKEQNFLVSGYHVGINTVMQSNKIAYHDLRSAPPIPKKDVGPWSQSSFQQPAGSGRRQFDLV